MYVLARAPTHAHIQGGIVFTQCDRFLYDEGVCLLRQLNFQKELVDCMEDQQRQPSALKLSGFKKGPLS